MSIRIMLKNVRLSYEHVWEPQSVNGSEPKYSASLIIPKSDAELIKQVEEATERVVQEDGPKKFGNKVPRLSMLKTPLRDGDTDRDDPGYADSMFINASSRTRPGIVDQNVQPILDREEVYSGCIVNASVELYVFNVNGNRGVAAGLGNIQKVADGERLGGGGIKAESEFSAIEGGLDFLS